MCDSLPCRDDAQGGTETQDLVTSDISPFPEAQGSTSPVVGTLCNQPCHCVGLGDAAGFGVIGSAGAITRFQTPTAAAGTPLQQRRKEKAS